MNRKISLSLSLLALSLSLPLAQAHAQGSWMGQKSIRDQFPRELYDTQKGSGSVERKGDKKLSLSSASVEFKRDGKATVKLVGRDSYELFGTWRATSVNSFTFTYTGGSSRSARTTGGGTIRTRDGRLNTISLNGDFGGDDFKANFEANTSSGGGSGSGGTTLTLEDNVDGNGFLNSEGNSDRTINRIEVKLYSNNAARVTLKVKTGGEHKLRGIWKRGLMGVYLLTDMKGDNVSEASGTMTVRRDDVTNLSLKGKLKGDRFTLNFRPR